MGTTFFPSIDTARSQSKALLSIETSGHHMKQSLLHTTKYLVGIPCGANADIGARRLLHEEVLRDKGVRDWRRTWYDTNSFPPLSTWKGSGNRGYHTFGYTTTLTLITLQLKSIIQRSSRFASVCLQTTYNRKDLGHPNFKVAGLEQVM